MNSWSLRFCQEVFSLYTLSLHHDTPGLYVYSLCPSETACAADTLIYTLVTLYRGIQFFHRYKDVGSAQNDL